MLLNTVLLGHVADQTRGEMVTPNLCALARKVLEAKTPELELSGHEFMWIKIELAFIDTPRSMALQFQLADAANAMHA